MQSAPVSDVINTPSPRKSSTPQNIPNCEFCLRCECVNLYSFVAQLFYCTVVERDFSVFVLQIVLFLWKILEPSRISITSRVSETIQSDQIMINLVPVMIASKWCHPLNVPATKTKHSKIPVYCYEFCYNISVHLKKKKKEFQNVTGSLMGKTVNLGFLIVMYQLSNF